MCNLSIKSQWDHCEDDQLQMNVSEKKSKNTPKRNSKCNPQLDKGKIYPE